MAIQTRDVSGGQEPHCERLATRLVFLGFIKSRTGCNRAGDKSCDNLKSEFLDTRQCRQACVQAGQREQNETRRRLSRLFGCTNHSNLFASEWDGTVKDVNNVLPLTHLLTRTTTSYPSGYFQKCYRNLKLGIDQQCDETCRTRREPPLFPN